MNRSKRKTVIRNTHADRKCRANILAAIDRRELRTMGA